MCRVKGLGLARKSEGRDYCEKEGIGVADGRQYDGARLLHVDLNRRGRRGTGFRHPWHATCAC